VTSLGSPFYVASPQSYRSGWRVTRLSSVYRFAPSLDDPQNAPPDTATYTLTSFEVPNSLVVSSAILYFKTQEGNYGRFLIERNPSTGNLIWGNYPYRYLTLKISYQSGPFIPYSEIASGEIDRKK
jgi:hypothetical protein